MSTDQPLGKILISSSQIQARVQELANDISTHYRGRPLLVVALMNGSLFFLVDLLKQMPPDYRVECWRVQSYHGEASTGRIEGLEYTTGDFHGFDVLIIDDVLDTGLTLHAVQKRVLELGANRADVCVLLQKTGTQKVEVTARWVGFTIGKEFVIGYGLDLDGKYRGYEDIRVLPSSS